MAAPKKPFVQGYDPRRDPKPPAKEEGPKGDSMSAHWAKLRGASPEEVEAVRTKGYFQKGHDPRRLSPEDLAKVSPRPSVARAAARLGWVERLPWLMGVIDGAPQPRVRIHREKDPKTGEPTGKSTEVKFEETPGLRERLEAMKQLGEMAGVKTMAFTDGEGDAPVFTPKFVLSNLTTEELHQLEALARRALPRDRQTLDAANEVRPADG